MNHTGTVPLIPVGRQQMVFELENVVNRIERRCRIKNVRSKPRPAGVLYDEFKRLTQPIWPFNGETGWKQTYMAKCGCKVGTTCGNVACPHRLEATC